MSTGRKRIICVVISNRASYGRVKSVLSAIQKHTALELQVIAFSSAVLASYGDVSGVIEADGFPLNARLFNALEGNTPATMAKSTGLAVIELTTQFEILKPNIVLTVADRYETLAVAIAATYMNILLAHTQGGEVTGSIDERVRHAVTKMADLHFPATRLSYDRLVCMGENPELIWLVGCPSIDLIVQTDLQANHFDLGARYGGLGAPIDPLEPFLLVLQHPVTTEFSQVRRHIEETLHALREVAMPTLMLWPNVDAGSSDISRGIRAFREQHDLDWLYLLHNVTPEDYLRLLYRSAAIVGNSSSGIREAGFLGVPSVNIGSRQQGRESGEHVIHVEYDRSAIASAIRAQLEKKRYPPSLLFGDGRAGERIADVLASVDLDAVRAKKRLMY